MFLKSCNNYSLVSTISSTAFLKTNIRLSENIQCNQISPSLPEFRLLFTVPIPALFHRLLLSAPPRSYTQKHPLTPFERYDTLHNATKRHDKPLNYDSENLRHFPHSSLTSLPRPASPVRHLQLRQRNPKLTTKANSIHLPCLNIQCNQIPTSLPEFRPLIHSSNPHSHRRLLSAPPRGYKQKHSHTLFDRYNTLHNTKRRLTRTLTTFATFRTYNVATTCFSKQLSNLARGIQSLLSEENSIHHLQTSPTVNTLANELAFTTGGGPRSFAHQSLSSPATTMTCSPFHSPRDVARCW